MPGYCSEDNLAALDTRKIDAHIAAGRHKHGAAAKPGGAIAEKLCAAGHQGPYRLRKPSVASGEAGPQIIALVLVIVHRLL